MLKMNVEKLKDTTVLHLDGRIMNGLESTMLRRCVISQEGASAIVLDFARVSGIDAAGLGVLLQLREWTQSKGIGFRFINVGRLVNHVFELTCLDSVFEISSAENLPTTDTAVRRSERAKKAGAPVSSNQRRLVTN